MEGKQLSLSLFSSSRLSLFSLSFLTLILSQETRLRGRRRRSRSGPAALRVVFFFVVAEDGEGPRGGGGGGGGAQREAPPRRRRRRRRVATGAGGRRCRQWQREGHARADGLRRSVRQLLRPDLLGGQLLVERHAGGALDRGEPEERRRGRRGGGGTGSLNGYACRLLLLLLRGRHGRLPRRRSLESRVHLNLLRLLLPRMRCAEMRRGGGAESVCVRLQFAKRSPRRRRCCRCCCVQGRLPSCSARGRRRHGVLKVLHSRRKRAREREKERKRKKEAERKSKTSSGRGKL